MKKSILTISFLLCVNVIFAQNAYQNVLDTIEVNSTVLSAHHKKMEADKSTNDAYASTSLIFTRTTASLANSINLPQGGKSIAYFILCVFFFRRRRSCVRALNFSTKNGWPF